MPSSDLNKVREICFSALPPNQAEPAMHLLAGLESLDVKLSTLHRDAVSIAYNVLDYTLEGLEEALVAQGFHLDNSLLQKIKRALVYYSESIQRENLKLPERTEKAQQIFVQVYDHHSHGDHDDTPVEWREYR